MTSAVVEEGDTFGKLITTPVPMWKAPEPLGVSVPLAVLGLMAMPALVPLAVIATAAPYWLATFTPFEAVSVSTVLALQLTLSYTFTLPEPGLLPALLCSVTLLDARLLDSAEPVMLPPL